MAEATVGDARKCSGAVDEHVQRGEGTPLLTSTNVSTAAPLAREDWEESSHSLVSLTATTGSNRIIRGALLCSIALIVICIACTGTANVSRWEEPSTFSMIVASLVGPTSTTTGPQNPSTTGGHIPPYPAIARDDFGPLREYSVVHTDRSLNLMSEPFQHVMRDLNLILTETYNAEKVAIIPGSGTYGMEAVARQYAAGKHVMVLVNGYFSYRWVEIFDVGQIPASHRVLNAGPISSPETDSNKQKQYQPHPVAKVMEHIKEERPAVLFAAHVETSTGIMLPDDYIRQVSAAVHDVGGLFVLDCIASGTVWVDMKELGIDVLITAPQKGWSGEPCAAMVQMSEAAVRMLDEKRDTSFSVSLKRWTAVMDAYVAGGYAYHTTPPTDSLRVLQELSVEMLQFGIPELKQAQLGMGTRARDVFDSKGLVSVSAPGFQAPGVLVYYSPDNTDNQTMMALFKQHGLQIASGVPWMIGEPHGLKTFRIGLFGLDKLENIDQTVLILSKAADNVLAALL